MVPLTATIQGLRVFTAPADGPARAALSFRAGWADEALVDHGISHLVEHLVLAPLGRPQFTWNGQTDRDQVTFWCEGTPEEVAWFLTAVAANIRDLPVQHLEVEKNLIRAEACHRHEGVAAVHDLWRWGTTGHGVGCYDELGLANLGPDRVRTWAAHHLTAENAVLRTTLAQPPVLDLPHGSLFGPVEPGTWRATSTPAWFPLEGTRVTLTTEVPFGHWAGVIGHLLATRLLERLRYAEGVSYSADFAVAPIGADLRRLLVTVDGLPDRMQQVATGAVEVVHELARTGPTPQELAEVLGRFERQAADPSAGLAELERLSSDYLCGRPLRAVERLHEELRALTGEQVAGFVREMMVTALWSVPPGVVVPDCPAAPRFSERRIVGSRWTPARGQLQDSYVDLTDDGITLVSEAAGGGLTVLWSQCSAVIGYDDGTRRVVGLDGFSFALFPERWDRWDQLRAAVDRLTPVGCYTHQGPAPERPAPSRPLVEVKGTSDAAWIAVGAACLLFAALLVAAAVADRDPTILSVSAVLAILGALPIWHVVRRRRRQRQGLDPVRVRRYKGVATWPTRYVVAWLVVSVGCAAWVWLAGVWVLGVLFTGAAVRAGRELSRRRARQPSGHGA